MPNERLDLKRTRVKREIAREEKEYYTDARSRREDDAKDDEVVIKADYLCALRYMIDDTLGRKLF
jgi:hypothetical protein